MFLKKYIYAYYIHIIHIYLENNIFLLFFLGPHRGIWRVPGQGSNRSYTTAYTTATAKSDLSRICDLHHSLWQHQMLTPLSKATDQTRNLMVPSQIRFRCIMRGSARVEFLSNSVPSPVAADLSFTSVNHPELNSFCIPPPIAGSFCFCLFTKHGASLLGSLLPQAACGFCSCTRRVCVAGEFHDLQPPTRSFLGLLSCAQAFS